MNQRYLIIAGMIILIFGGLFGIVESVSGNNVIEGICSGLLLGLVPMGWNELQTIKEEDVKQ